MRIVYAGNNERGVACLQALVNSDQADVVAVISMPKNDHDEGYFRAIGADAASLGLEVFDPVDVNKEPTVQRLVDLKPDLLVMVGYPQIVREAVRTAPRLGTINVHASPLPRYRGAAPLNWMIINGERTGAITILEVDGGLDTGPILAQEPFPISEDATIRDVTEYVNRRAPEMLVETLRDFPSLWEGRQPQDPKDGFFMTRRRPEDGLVDFRNLDASAVRNLARALVFPYPGAYFFYQGRRFRIEQADLPERTYYGRPGRIAAREDGGVVVIARDRGILLRSLRLDDGFVVPADKANFRIGADVDPLAYEARTSL